MSNLFAKAQKTKKSNSIPKKSSNKPEYKVEGLEELASLDRMIKVLEARKKVVEGEVKDRVKSHFISVGMSQGKNPDSYTGVEGNAEANCQLRKRTSRATLTDEEIALLNDAEVPFGAETTVEEAYRINPKYSENQELLQKVSEAIQTVDGVPDDFIEFQEGSQRYVVTEESLREAFRVSSSDQVEALLDVVGTIAIKAKLNTEDTEKLKAMAEELL